MTNLFLIHIFVDANSYKYYKSTLKMNRNINNRLGVIGELPAMPHIANKVMELVGDPKSSTQELQNLISLDEGLSSKVLKMANSAFFGCMSTITSLRQALVIIGFNTIKSLVIASSTSSLFKKTRGGDETVSKKLWEHSVGCSFAARLIAKKKGISEIDEAFTGGLLHDFGRLILNYKLSDEFKYIAETANREHKPYNIAEREILGFDHADVGLLLSEKWKLPELLSDIIFYHHDPSKSKKYKDIVSIVMLADIICIKKGIGVQTDRSINIDDTVAAKILNLKSSDIAPLTEKFADILKAELSLFSME